MKTRLLYVLASLLTTESIGYPNTAYAAPSQRNSNSDDEIIEGDILVTEPLRRALKAGNSRTKRDIVSNKIKRWPDGVVPYKLDSSLNKDALKAIKEAIREFHQRTCVKFVPHTNEQDYLEFQGNYG